MRSWTGGIGLGSGVDEGSGVGGIGKGGSGAGFGGVGARPWLCVMASPLAKAIFGVSDHVVFGIMGVVSFSLRERHSCRACATLPGRVDAARGHSPKSIPGRRVAHAVQR